MPSEKICKIGLGIGLQYDSGTHSVEAENNADFAGSPDTRTSAYVTVLYYASNPVSWCTRRIKTVVTSTLAAEYIGQSQVAFQVNWLRNIVAELTPHLLPPSLLGNDSQAALKAAQGSAPILRTKHINVHYHDVQDKACRRIIKLHYIPTTNL